MKKEKFKSFYLLTFTLVLMINLVLPFNLLKASAEEPVDSDSPYNVTVDKLDLLVEGKSVKYNLTYTNHDSVDLGDSFVEIVALTKEDFETIPMEELYPHVIQLGFNDIVVEANSTNSVTGSFTLESGEYIIMASIYTDTGDSFGYVVGHQDILVIDNLGGAPDDEIEVPGIPDEEIEVPGPPAGREVTNISFNIDISYSNAPVVVGDEVENIKPILIDEEGNEVYDSKFEIFDYSEILIEEMVSVSGNENIFNKKLNNYQLSPDVKTFYMDVKVSNDKYTIDDDSKQLLIVADETIINSSFNDLEEFKIFARENLFNNSELEVVSYNDVKDLEQIMITFNGSEILSVPEVPVEPEPVIPVVPDPEPVVPVVPDPEPVVPVVPEPEPVVPVVPDPEPVIPVVPEPEPVVPVVPDPEPVIPVIPEPEPVEPVPAIKEGTLILNYLSKSGSKLRDTVIIKKDIRDKVDYNEYVESFSSYGLLSIDGDKKEYLSENEVINISYVYKNLSEVPVEEVPIEEVPIEELPIEELPIEEVPVDEIPVDEIPVDEIPVEENPIDEIPVEENPIDEIPVEENPILVEPIIEKPSIVTPVGDIKKDNPVIPKPAKTGDGSVGIEMSYYMYILLLLGVSTMFYLLHIKRRKVKEEG